MTENPFDDADTKPSPTLVEAVLKIYFEHLARLSDECPVRREVWQYGETSAPALFDMLAKLSNLSDNRREQIHDLCAGLIESHSMTLSIALVTMFHHKKIPDEAVELLAEDLVEALRDRIKNHNQITEVIQAVAPSGKVH